MVRSTRILFLETVTALIKPGCDGCSRVCFSGNHGNRTHRLNSYCYRRDTSTTCYELQNTKENKKRIIWKMPSWICKSSMIYTSWLCCHIQRDIWHYWSVYNYFTCLSFVYKFGERCMSLSNNLTRTSERQSRTAKHTDITELLF